ncbi:MAG: FAD-binding protein [Solirubrobacteraceae bacterium]
MTVVDAALAGWVLPVVPGAQHVTVGGAIACDIHAKNHSTAGTFGAHVAEMRLMTAGGELLTVSPAYYGDAMRATVGGMGLTGGIVSAKLRLRPLPSSWLAVDTDRVRDLDEALAILDGPGGPHRVAWLDLLGGDPVRGVVTRADHLSAPAAPAAGPDAIGVGARTRIPPRWPAGKDRRLPAATLAAMYPRLDEWCAVRDRLDPERRWRSGLGLRVGLVEGGR